MPDHYTYVTLTKKSPKSTSAYSPAQRFASRRGIPECIISDNAKTFKAGSQDLQALKVLAEEDNLKK